MRLKESCVLELEVVCRPVRAVGRYWERYPLGSFEDASMSMLYITELCMKLCKELCIDKQMIESCSH